MPSTKRLQETEAAPAKYDEPDWVALDALTDEDIAAQVTGNSDAAPTDRDWSKAVVTERLDVKAIRAKTGLSQDEFAKTFGLNVTSLREWEQKRRVPRGPAQTLLQIIDREPDAVRRALHVA